MGLSGLGDLVLTATGDLSRNRQVGLRARRRASRWPAILAELGHVAEGVRSAPMVLARAAPLRRRDADRRRRSSQVLEGRIAPAARARAADGREARAGVVEAPSRRAQAAPA